jgi:hypothetical protein
MAIGKLKNRVDLLERTDATSLRRIGQDERTTLVTSRRFDVDANGIDDVIVQNAIGRVQIRWGEHVAMAAPERHSAMPSPGLRGPGLHDAYRAAAYELVVVWPTGSKDVVKKGGYEGRSRRHDLDASPSRSTPIQALGPLSPAILSASDVRRLSCSAT